MTSKLSFLKFNPPIFFLFSFHHVNFAKLQCLNLNFANSASRKPREYQMPGFASVLMILCAYLSLIEATWTFSISALLFFSHAVSASCQISMLWLASRKLRECQMPGVSSVLVTLCACPFYHWSDYHFNIAIYQSWWSFTFNLLQERCVNARCLGFPASLWRYAHFLSTIEAGVILTCHILHQESHRSRIYRGRIYRKGFKNG